MPADFNDRTDFENADRGFIARFEPMTISDAQGRQVWDMDGWSFLDDACPDTEHTEVSAAGLAPALTVTQLFDSIAIRIDGPKAWGEQQLRINRTVTGETGDGTGGPGAGRYRMELGNGALIHFPAAADEDADLAVTLSKPQLVGLLLHAQTDGVEMSGDPGVLATLVGLLDTPDPDFAVVTPSGAPRRQVSSGSEPPATS